MEHKITPGEWKAGLRGDCVISDHPLPGYGINGGHDDIKHYGGHLIAESIWRIEDVRAISATPNLLAALIAMREYLSKCRPHAGDKSGAEWGVMMDQSHAAILKATGGEA